MTVSSEVIIPAPKQLDVGDKGNEKPEVLEDTWYAYENTIYWKIQEATNIQNVFQSCTETEIYSLMQLK